jgi:O-antigen/teichoic acid export membrane protein
VQSVILTKKVDFKTKAKINVSSSLIAGTIAIYLAYKDFGVWSLVYRGIILSVCICVLLWIQSNWKPIMVFSKKSFKELFGFGGKVLVSDMLEIIYAQIFNPIIGKIFSPAMLGYYTRAQQMNALFSSAITGNIQKVTFPVLSSIQDDKKMLLISYRKVVKSTMLLVCSLLLGVLAVANPMITLLFGTKWIPCVPYLQLMSLTGLVFPLYLINLNILKVTGRMGAYLKIEVIKKSISIPLLFVCYFWGIETLLIGIFLVSLVAYLICSYWSGKVINYPLAVQLKDIFPFFIVAMLVSAAIWSINILNIPALPTLLIQILLALILTDMIYKVIKNQDYLYLKNTLLMCFKKIK